MIELDLVKITDTSGKVTGEKGKVIYKALTDKEFDNLVNMESDYSMIGREFKVEMLGTVQVPSIGGDDESDERQ